MKQKPLKELKTRNINFKISQNDMDYINDMMTKLNIKNKSKTFLKCLINTLENECVNKNIEIKKRGEKLI
jgi:hypothetical protein